MEVIKFNKMVHLDYHLKHLFAMDQKWSENQVFSMWNAPRKTSAFLYFKNSGAVYTLPDGTDFSAFFSRRGGNLNRVMARWFALGMDLKGVLACVTANPAKAYHLEGVVGCLSPGVAADIAILKEYNELSLVEDHEGEIITCPKCLQCKATISDGKFVWNDFYI